MVVVLPDRGRLRLRCQMHQVVTIPIGVDKKLTGIVKSVNSRKKKDQLKKIKTSLVSLEVGLRWQEKQEKGGQKEKARRLEKTEKMTTTSKILLLLLLQLCLKTITTIIYTQRFIPYDIRFELVAFISHGLEWFQHKCTLRCEIYAKDSQWDSGEGLLWSGFGHFMAKHQAWH